MALKIVYKKTSELIPYIRNSRTHSTGQVSQIAASIKEFGFTNPVLIDGESGVIAGHGRIQAASLLKMDEVPTIMLDHLSEAQKRALVIADNKLALNAGWDDEQLKFELKDLEGMDFDLSLTGFDLDELGDLFDEPPEEKYADGVAGSMAENYGVPPFSVLDTRQGPWLERKRAWRARIGDSAESRENKLGSLHNFGEMNGGTSILDPVLAEICVSWFGFSGGVAFDPFAGDTVFGFVAGSLGMEFHGIELRKEQADLNQARCAEANLPCTYYCDTSENMSKHIKDNSVDLVFSCPPYADLEVYSDNPLDLSTMGHDDFFQVYKRILQGTFAKLKENRFAVVVMGEVRGKNGEYIGTIPKTIQIMEEAGYKFYNEMILVNGAGTLPLRAGKSMTATRKIGKMHQNILVFLKGDAKLAVADLGPIKLNFGDENAN